MAESTLKTANEVKRQRGKVEEQLGHLVSTMYKLNYNTRLMSEEFNTDDSQIMSKLNELISRLEYCKESLTDKFEIVMEEMDTYYTQTIANLGQLETQVDSTMSSGGGNTGNS